MPDLVLKHGDSPGVRPDAFLDLLHEAGVSTLEAVVQVHEDGQQGDALRRGLIPVIHMRRELLASAVPVPAEPRVESREFEVADALWKIGANAREEIRSEGRVVSHYPILIAVKRIVGCDARRRALDLRAHLGALASV